MTHIAPLYIPLPPKPLGKALYSPLAYPIIKSPHHLVFYCYSIPLPSVALPP